MTRVEIENALEWALIEAFAPRVCEIRALPSEGVRRSVSWPAGIAGRRHRRSPTIDVEIEREAVEDLASSVLEDDAFRDRLVTRINAEKERIALLPRHSTNEPPPVLQIHVGPGMAQ